MNLGHGIDSKHTLIPFFHIFPGSQVQFVGLTVGSLRKNQQISNR